MQQSRRGFLAFLAPAALAIWAPFRAAPARAQAGAAPAQGGAAPHLSETDPLAQSLGYKDDAGKVDKAKFPTYKPGQECDKCRFFTGKAGEAYGPCQIFAGKAVSAKGWCASFSPKT